MKKNIYSQLSIDSVAFCTKLGLLNNECLCVSCNLKMKLIKDKSLKDGCRWVCFLCKNKKSIRYSSYFHGSHLSLESIIKIFNKLSFNIEIEIALFDLNINRKTISKFSNLIREAIVYYFMINNEKIGGIKEDGTPCVVEIDESYFFKRKYYRGLLREGTWYVRGVERNTSKCFMFPVQNRNTDTMRNIINENVNPGSIIITDEWRAYSAALNKKEFYEHYTINHSFYFVDPTDDFIHT